MTGAIYQKINTKKLDSFISLVIDPHQRTFTRNTLIKEYNYPEGDVYAIDLDDW